VNKIAGTRDTHTGTRRYAAQESCVWPPCDVTDVLGYSEVANARETVPRRTRVLKTCSAAVSCAIYHPVTPKQPHPADRRGENPFCTFWYANPTLYVRGPCFPFLSVILCFLLISSLNYCTPLFIDPVPIFGPFPRSIYLSFPFFPSYPFLGLIMMLKILLGRIESAVNWCRSGRSYGALQMTWCAWNRQNPVLLMSDKTPTRNSVMR